MRADADSTCNENADVKKLHAGTARSASSRRRRRTRCPRRFAFASKLRRRRAGSPPRPGNEHHMIMAHAAATRTSTAALSTGVQGQNGERRGAQRCPGSSCGARASTGVPKLKRRRPHHSPQQRRHQFTQWATRSTRRRRAAANGTSPDDLVVFHECDVARGERGARRGAPRSPRAIPRAADEVGRIHGERPRDRLVELADHRPRCRRRGLAMTPRRLPGGGSRARGDRRRALALADPAVDEAAVEVRARRHDHVVLVERRRREAWPRERKRDAVTRCVFGAAEVEIRRRKAL